MKLLPLLALALLALLAAPPARAQVETREGIFLQNQIQELKRDIALLRDQLARGGSQLGSAPRAPAGPVVASDVTAALLDRVARLEDEVRQLRGQADEAANAQRRMGEDLGKQIEDLNFKLGTASPGPARPPGRQPRRRRQPFPPRRAAPRKWPCRRATRARPARLRRRRGRRPRGAGRAEIAARHRRPVPAGAVAGRQARLPGRRGGV